MRQVVYSICGLLLLSAVCDARQAAGTAAAAPTVATSQVPTSSPEIGSFAAQIAQQIEKKHLKAVLVIGAVGGDPGKLTQDGQEIGDRVSAALTKNANGFQVVDRATLRDLLRKNGVSETMAVSDVLANWVARLAKVAGYVVIQIGAFPNGKVKIAANLYRTELGDVTLLGTTKTELELSDEQKRVGFRPLDSDWNKPTLSIEDTKKLPPDRSPKCASCPPPQFSDSFRHAVGRSAEESVGMYVTVFRDGSVGELALVKPGPVGMTTIAVNTILQKWHFKPALDANGKPMAFRSFVEISFQSY
jgi:hypothetical protein